MNFVRFILSLVARFGWKIHHMDVTSAFIHGDLSEEIYMEQPLGFVTNSNLICRLKNFLYGLKHAPWPWYTKIDNLFLQLGFKWCESDQNPYVLHSNGDIIIVVVYVDDLIITRNNIVLIFRLKKQLVDSFGMIDLGTLHYFLGFQVLPLCNGFFISQSKYVMDPLTCFKMAYCKPCATPFQTGVKLTKTYQTCVFDATLYQQLVDILIYLSHS
jgi:hypothetical protein